MNNIEVITVTALVFIEALYILISLRAISREKLGVTRNAFLFFGVIAANLASGVIAGNVFRFLLVSALIFGLMKLVSCEKVYFYNFFLIMLVISIKMTLEIIYIVLIVGLQNFTMTLSIAGGIIFLIFPIAMLKPTKKTCEKINAFWQKEGTFYIRYALVITMIAGVMIYTHILNKYIITIGG